MAGLTVTLSIVQELEKAIKFVRIACNINLACFVVMYYDWITTLSTEIKLIWKAKWSQLTVSYLLARYLTLAYCPLILYYQFGYSLSESTCTKLYDTIVLTIAVTVLCAAMILTVRTVAIWEQRKYITWVAFGLFAVTAVFVLIFSALSLKHTNHTKPLIIGRSIGCIQTFRSLHLAVVFIAGAVFDTVNLSLLLIRGTSLFWWGRDSRLFRTVYGDGVLFYVYMSGMSILNLIFIFGSIEYQSLLLMIPGALRSLLACRVVLHLRMQRNEPPVIGMSQDAVATAQQSKMSALEFRAV